MELSGEETGERFRASAQWQRLSPKVQGQHRWVASAFYVMTDTECTDAMEGVAVVLDGEKLLDIVIGCLDCEEPYVVARTLPCLARGYDPFKARP